VGTITADMTAREFSAMESDFWWLKSGGHHKPSNLYKESGFQNNVAIIIPIRDREEHLKILLNNLHPILHRQNLRYTVYVVEQVSVILLREETDPNEKKKCFKFINDNVFIIAVQNEHFHLLNNNIPLLIKLV
jgi:hypothetical protein